MSDDNNHAMSMTRTLSPEQVRVLTDRVEVAQQGATAMPKLTEDFPGMTLGDGYAVQLALRDRWVAAGRRQAGWKAGLTSKAKMDQMGVRVPTVGFLLADMARPESSAVRCDDMVHPRVECEIAFVLKAPLAGPDVTREQVLAATDFIVPAIEVIDSRYTGFKFDLQSVVADNSSSARYAIGGQPRLPADVELDALGVVLEKNGEPLAIAASAAVMGHPADAVAMVAKVLHELGESLPAGAIVLSGAITEAFAVKPGDVISARFRSLGSVGLRFV